MKQSCKHCETPFEITSYDLHFYDNISPSFDGSKCPIPPPTLCPQCRLQRRLAFINQITVYTRTSSISGKRIFAMFPQNVPFPVFENEYWWSDAWSALDYGREIDWSSPFFAQHDALQSIVPHFALMVLNNDNCDYCNNSSENRHCYLCFNTRRSEDCFSCERSVASRSCADCTDIGTSERCDNCVACHRCYGLRESQESVDCSESAFLLNCRSCRSCFGCVNLRHAEFCVFNEQKTKEEYEAFMREINLASYAERMEWRAKTDAFWVTQPRPHAVMIAVENVSGNYLLNCKNVKDSYFIRDGEDLSHCALAVDGVKNCRDYSTYGDRAEWVYESARCGNGFSRSAFCYYSYDGCSDLWYCSYCVGCKDCFGCIGVRKKQYCILNKQYTKEAYHALVPRLIEHMRTTGEWGEFFPMTASPNPYSHTSAQRYFPMTKDAMLAKGLRWQDDEFPTSGTVIEAHALPDSAPEGGVTIAVKSGLSGKPFSITHQEIKHYASLGAPLPRTTYAERMEARAKRLGKMTLYERRCAKTGQPIQTVIPPDAPWIVWEKDEYEKEFSA